MNFDALSRSTQLKEPVDQGRPLKLTVIVDTGSFLVPNPFKSVAFMISGLGIFLVANHPIPIAASSLSPTVSPQPLSSVAL